MMRAYFMFIRLGLLLFFNFAYFLNSILDFFNFYGNIIIGFYIDIFIGPSKGKLSHLMIIKCHNLSLF